MTKQRTVLYLQTFEQEAHFVDFLHEVERSDDPIRARTAREIHARFMGRTLADYEAMMERVRQSRRDLEEAWNLA